MATPRKSGRQRVPNKKYLDEDIEVLNDILSSDSESEAINRHQIEDPGKGDDDFSAAVAETIEISSKSDSSNSQDGPSDGSAIATPAEHSEDAQSHGSSPEPFTPRKPTNVPIHTRYRPKSRNQWGNRSDGVDTHSKGIPENLLYMYGKHNRMYAVTGPGEADIAHITRARDLWGNDLTLPRRAKMRFCFSHTEEQRQWEGTKGWKWYYKHGGREAFARRQTVRFLNESEEERYVKRPSSYSHAVLLGPYGRQKLFSISVLRPLSVDEAWNEAVNAHSANKTQEGPFKMRRHAWMLNVGNRVRWLDWAANHEGDTQYLAVAVRSKAPKEAWKDAPSFTPVSPTPSNIQIWAFSASPGKAPAESALDLNRLPVLKQVLCSEWGDAKLLKWCPMPRSFNEEGSETKASTGLLAGVWDDGNARVLDVRCDKDRGTSYLSVESAACTIPRLANSICTSLCWLSASDLAIGHSNGFLTIYSIVPKPPTALPLPQQGDAIPQATSTIELSSSPPAKRLFPTRRALVYMHQTYITSLTTAYPSFPTLLISTTAAGHSRLTSLSAPTAAYVQSRRSHAVPNMMSYHHGLYGSIYADDSKEAICYTGLRFWGNSISVADTTSSGGGLAVDAGKVHAAVAFGLADGEVVIVNPMRKVLKTKEKGWQQTVFKHEWVRKRRQAPKEGNSENGRRNDGVEEEEEEDAEREGISRITESYKPQPVDVDRRPISKKIVGLSGRGGRGSALSTIFEEETGTTAVCWNPNVSCGGWLAVGWASGLVRVEDVAI